MVATFKLRPVLVLHDGTEPGIQDVAVAKIGSIKSDRPQSRAKWYARVSGGTHRTQFIIRRVDHSGLKENESYVDVASIAVVPKAVMLRRVDKLDEDEMFEVSTRLVTALEIGVSGYLRKISPAPDA